jgi:hypothetical protein
LDNFERAQVPFLEPVILPKLAAAILFHENINLPRFGAVDGGFEGDGAWALQPNRNEEALH